MLKNMFKKSLMARRRVSKKQISDLLDHYVNNGYDVEELVKMAIKEGWNEGYSEGYKEGVSDW